MRRAIALAAALLLLTGCASVPSGSRVVRGSAGGLEQPIDDPYVRIIPVGPGRGWSPVTIVTGFRNASASFDGPNGEHQVAREYLACGGCWRPGVASIVYDRLDPLELQTDGGDRATVTATGRQLGRIGADGQYIADGGRFRVAYVLRRSGAGQWRITSPPQQLLLSRDDVDRAFRALNLYFFAPDAQVLVPNPVYIPLVSRPWLARQLARQLIGGPTTWLAGAGVRTAFPDGARLRRLDISGGVATVDLSSPARYWNTRDISIQLMWTLRQLSEVKQLKLEINGTPVHAPGAEGVVQSPADWAAYDPDGVAVEPPAYVRNADGLLARLIGSGSQPIVPKMRVSHPAISYDGSRVAFLDDTRHLVSVVAKLGRDTPRVVLSTHMKGARFDAPSWDTRGNVWVVESSSKGSRLWVIDGGVRAIAVNGWSLSQYPVAALRVSRDGTRAAAIVDVGGSSQIQLGRVDRAPSGGLQAEGFVAINAELQSAIDLAWSSSDHLAVVGVAPGNPSPLLYDVPVSGAPAQSTAGPGGDMNAVATFPRAPLYISQSVSGARPQQSVCRLSDRFGVWNCWNGTSDPAFPG